MTSLALITGASRGIGLAAAEKFVQEGWTVHNLSRNPCPLPGVVHHACDLSSPAQMDKALDSIDFAQHARVSIVHNAGITCNDTCLDASEENFRRLFEVNVAAPQFINKRLLPRLPQGSSIVFIGSTLSTIGAPNSLSYTTSKHALAGLMKATAQDLAGRGIHTCLICPGFTDTQMLQEVVGDNAEKWAAIKNMVLFGRLARPEEIAALIFFCSGNPVINGAVLHADLGQR